MNTLSSYLESAHGTLVQAAKIAHLERHPEAENISKLIDDLEEIDLCMSIAEETSKIN
jgi:hypothetical protein